MSITSKESTPPPTIGKIGPYTVFVTPPATPSPKSSRPVSVPPAKKAVSPPTPPVQLRTPPPVVLPPPQQFYKPAAAPSPSKGSVSGFFRDAVVSVQNAHSSLDKYVAHWFGLNQSKYQWALDDYYETKGEVISVGLYSEYFKIIVKLHRPWTYFGDQVKEKAKDISNKEQSV